MNKVFLGHVHYIPSAILSSKDVSIAAVIVPEVYPNLISTYYNEVTYFRSPLEFINYFRTLNYPLSSAYFSLENINLLDDITKIPLLKENGLVSIQVFHHSSNPYFNTKTGLTPLGKSLLYKIMENNLTLDLSHLDNYWLNKILEEYEGKIVISHCAISDLLNDSNNRTNCISYKTAEQLIKRNCLIGISFVNDTISFNSDEMDENIVFNDIIKQISTFVHHFGSQNIYLGPDYFDTMYFSKVYNHNLFIPKQLYSLDGFYELFEILTQSIGKEVNNIFWDNANNFFSN